MYRILSIFLLSAVISSNAVAQSVSGILQDAGDKTPLSNATVKLSKSDSSFNPLVTVTDAQGSFVFNNVPGGNYSLVVTSVGYGNFKKNISVTGKNINLGNISVSKNAETLTTVVINDAPAVKQKDDTLEFAASQYKVNPDATSEDIIKKMPGITVDKSGTVTAQGQTVQKVTVDGRDFFGDDATATLRNLPAEVIDKIQVFDKLSDQAQLTGFDDGNTTKAINIVTKKDMRQGNFGRIFAGYGTDGRYSAGGNVSFFNNARRISLIGLENNVNQQNFSSQDLLGVTSTGNRGGGGQRGGGGSNNFSVGQQTGIAKTTAFGINYSDAWGKKIDVTGSYFFNNSNTSNNQTISQQNIITKDSSQYYDENTISDNKNSNNRVNFRLTYRIDSNNSILVTSNLKFQDNNSVNFVNGTNYLDVNRQTILSKTVNDLNSRYWGNSLSNQVLFRHAFHKRGRSISLGINGNFNDKSGDNYLTAVNTYYKSTTITDSVQQLSNQKNYNRQYIFNLVYTEPVGKKGQLQLNYNPSFSNNNADQETNNYDEGTSKYSNMDTSLSNKFNNTYNTQNTGITFRHGDRNNMISAGISYQYSELKSNQVFPQVSYIDNSYSNILGNAFARFKFSARSNLRIIYRSSVSPPSVTQLQNVINNSNQFFYTTGNPDLQQQYSNNLITRYTYTNSAKSQSFFANIFLQTVNNYVANATYTASKDSALSKTIILFRGSQISKPVNLNGYISARSFFTFGMPLTFMKSILNWNAGVSYTKLPGLINNVDNISNAYNYNLGAVLASNISQYIDFTLSYAANINTVKNSIRPSLNNNYFQQTAGIAANLLTKKGLFFNNDLSNELYKGLTGGLNTNYWLWNIAVGQKFLKNQMGELKLSVFDLLKQNKSITRNVTDSYIQDVQNQVLQQYFMLTFTYKLKTFGKGKPINNDEREREGRQFGGHGGPPFGGHGGPDL
ncbi:MAG: outer membrane beta-barrel protein [Bacteroidota bacterium]|nr:outer membrane beta-barrel protein [Bacteroidota bacterium]